MRLSLIIWHYRRNVQDILPNHGVILNPELILRQVESQVVDSLVERGENPYDMCVVSKLVHQSNG